MIQPFTVIKLAINIYPIPKFYHRWCRSIRKNTHILYKQSHHLIIKTDMLYNKHLKCLVYFIISILLIKRSKIGSFLMKNKIQFYKYRITFIFHNSCTNFTKRHKCNLIFHKQTQLVIVLYICVLLHLWKQIHFLLPKHYISSVILRYFWGFKYTLNHH